MGNSYRLITRKEVSAINKDMISYFSDKEVKDVLVYQAYQIWLRYFSAYLWSRDDRCSIKLDHLIFDDRLVMHEIKLIKAYYDGFNDGMR
jgi:hypothetical protein